ncbi:MAG: hypothetical protein GX616_11725 [Planctomycetes bacterium]|nr:hypothetical protein [Planctomycetota bacterium]
MTYCRNDEPKYPDDGLAEFLAERSLDAYFAEQQRLRDEELYRREGVYEWMDSLEPGELETLQRESSEFVRLNPIAFGPGGCLR